MFFQNQDNSQTQPSYNSIYLRNKEGCFSYNEIGGQLTKVSNQNNLMIISSNENNLVLGSSDQLTLFENDLAKNCTVGKNIQYIEFVMDDNFLILIDKIDNTTFICQILSRNLELWASIQLTKYTKSLGPQVVFDSVNQLCFVALAKEISIYNIKDFDVVNRLQLSANQYDFSISNAHNTYISIVELKQALQIPLVPSIFQVWNLSDLQKPYLEIEICTAQEVKQMWNKEGKFLLVWVQLLDDKTNQSYYGQHHLYHLDVERKGFRNLKMFDGPIHDVAWDSKGEKFLVSSGFMPSGSVLFDKTGLQLYLIAQHHVNFIKWAPQGNIVCFAGFGNLPGEIEIWDMDNLKQIGKCRKDKVILFEWSPCSNFFLVATTFPRLRVNNMIQIYNIEGKLLFEQPFEELYDVRWKQNSSPAISSQLLEVESLKQNIVVQKKTLNFQKSNCVQNLKGQNLTANGPVKLNKDDILWEMNKKSLSNVQVESFQQQQILPVKPQAFLSRRQTPVEFTSQNKNNNIRDSNQELQIEAIENSDDLNQNQENKVSKNVNAKEMQKQGKNYNTRQQNNNKLGQYLSFQEPDQEWLSQFFDNQAMIDDLNQLPKNPYQSYQNPSEN